MSKKIQKITVSGLLAVNEKVLLVRRSSGEDYLAGYYELPGGKVDFGEHPEETLVREFREETSLKIKVLPPLRIFTYISHQEKRHTVELVYKVKLDGNLNIKLSPAHDDYQWVSLKELDKFQMSDEIRENLKQGLR